MRVGDVVKALYGDDLVWRWGPYKNRLRRLISPDDAS